MTDAFRLVWIGVYSAFVAWGLFIVIKEIRLGHDGIAAVMLGIMVLLGLSFLDVAKS